MPFGMMSGFGTRNIVLRGGDDPQGEWAILGVSFPIDNALYSVAFGTHTKTAEPM